MSNAIMQCLATFRPSDRKLLSLELSTENSRDCAILSIKEFVVRWERADWLDDGSISRIGRWLATYQPADVVGQLLEWANSAASAARSALAEGIKEGLRRRSSHG
jgi:hypothetical protein